MRQLRVAIVGCGTAGQASAVLLARQGHRVEVFERAGVLGPVGAGLLLQPAGQRVLGKMGLLGQVERQGAVVHRLVGQNERGRSVLDVRYADAGAVHGVGLSGLGVHRGVLFSVLQAALREAGATVYKGRHVAGCEQDERGAVLVLDGGERVGMFDLVVACDGSRSRVRGALDAQRGIVRRSALYEFGALWCVVEDVLGEHAGVLRQAYAGTSRMLGVLPTGRPDGARADVVSVFWSVRGAEVGRVRRAGLEAWRAEAGALAPWAKGLLAQVRSIEELVYAPYYDVVCDTPVVGRCVLVGDAAHAMSPQLGLGANLALADAWALARAVERALSRGETVEDALGAYAGARAREIAWYSFVSRGLTPVFQSEWDALGPLRDWAWPWLMRAPVVKQLALASLVGRRGA